jgi:hypothetical protein
LVKKCLRFVVIVCLLLKMLFVFVAAVTRVIYFFSLSLSLCLSLCLFSCRRNNLLHAREHKEKRFNVGNFISLMCLPPTKPLHWSFFLGAFASHHTLIENVSEAKISLVCMHHFFHHEEEF